MKAILSRLFNHEELTRKEAKNLLLNITRGMYNDAQIAALLTVFQMRGIKVEELIGFREALLTTRIPIDFSATALLTLWVQAVMEKTPSTSLLAPASL